MVDVMLDVVFPVTPANVAAAELSIDSLVEHTQFDIRVILVMDGGKRSIYQSLEDTIRTKVKSWSAIHNIQPVGYNKCFVDATERLLTDRVLTMDPMVVIRDDQWFTKLCIPFGRDRGAAMVLGGVADTASTSLPPTRIVKSFRVFNRVSVIRVWNKDPIRIGEQVEGVDIIESIANNFQKTGFNLWSADGLNYSLTEAKAQKS